MSLSIQTNVSSLIAQNNIRTNSAFQANTVTQLSSGYRINSSADDAAGLAVANKYRSSTAELTQGVQNANDGISQLQIVDGGLNNISKMLDRMKTLATESASTTFTGDRNNLSKEYVTLQGEIDRQASNIGLNLTDTTGGNRNIQNVKVYIGGGSSTTDATNAQVGFDLSGANVNQTGLTVNGTSVVGGSWVSAAALGTGSVVLNAGTKFLAGDDTEAFKFTSIGAGGGAVTITVGGGTNGVTGAQLIDNLNGQLSPYGISASTDANGKLQFTSAATFKVAVDVSASATTDGTSSTSNDVVGSVNGTSGTAVTSAVGTQSATAGTGNALAALAAIAVAIQNLGTVQGKVGAAENQLGYAVNLAQSQITNYSAAEAGIRDADVAAQAANLTKAQVLQQASIAALAQANSAPQAVLKLLQG